MSHCCYAETETKSCMIIKNVINVDHASGTLSHQILLFFILQTILIQNIYRNPQNSAQTADASRCKLTFFQHCFLKNGDPKYQM